MACHQAVLQEYPFEAPGEDDLYTDYQRATEEITEIAKQRGTGVPERIKQCVYGPGFYVVVTPDGKIIGDCTSKGEKDYPKYLKEAIDANPGMEVHPNGIKPDGEQSSAKVAPPVVDRQR